MGVFGKAVLNGTYQGQTIVNILYYGDDGGTEFPVWSELIAQALAEAVEDMIVPDYLTNLPSTYTLSSIVVTGVDERGVTVSDNEYELAIGDPGGNATNSEGQAQVAILAFQTTKHPIAGRNVKRSYLAYGPLADNQQNSDGSVDATFATSMVDLLAALQGIISNGPLDFRPVRIGRTVDPAPIAVGLVSLATLRPFASFRKSRKRRPTGL